MKDKLLLKTHVVRLDSIARLRKDKRLLRATFTKHELAYSLKKRFPDQSLGARLAAKKALLAALGKKRARKLSLKDIEISNDLYGKPHFKRRLAGVRALAVSLSHTEHYAVASVMVLA